MEGGRKKEKYRLILNVGAPLASDSSLLFHLQLVIKEEQSFLVRFRSSNYGKHSLTGLIMGSFCDANFGTRKTTNFGNFCAATTDDTAYHIGGN